MNTSPHERSSRSEQRRANPLAVLGALGLVAIAIAFGVLGPQISDRGSMVFGISLDTVLREAAATYEHDRDRASFGRWGDAPTVAMIDDVLARRFMGRATYQDLGIEGLEPIWLDPRVLMEGLSTEGVSVTYAGVTPGTGDMAVLMLLYAEDTHPLITQDTFGTPLSMVQGHVYVRTINTGSGMEVWSASWHDAGVLYVLMAPTGEMLSESIKALGVSDVEDVIQRAIASSGRTSEFDQGHDRGTLG